MLSYLDNSEASKVSTKELKEQVLSPNHTSVNIVRIVRQARSEKHNKIVPDLQQTRSTRDPSRQYGEVGGASDTAHDSGAGECLDLSDAIKQLSEKQEIVGYSDGEQDESAESRLLKNS